MLQALEVPEIFITKPPTADLLDGQPGQAAYEIIFGREFDKRNFRKKFLSLNLIHETDELWRDGAHRPAKLYQFNSQTLESLSRSFD